TCGEGFDSADLLLPLAQRKLIERVAQARRPIILICECGRPYCIQEQSALSDAVLYAWYPGEQGGYAICDILFGDVSPSGRLPISFPQSVGHIPCYYNCKTSARGVYHKPGSHEKPGRDYIFSGPEPLYPFGYGLSYTTFEYSDLTAAVVGEDVEVTVDVANTGNMKADDSVLVFLTQHYCETTPFVKRLRKFKRVTLDAGEKKTLKFTLSGEDFTYINLEMKKARGKGLFTVRVGELTADFEL
nr:glycoside hydrolase family 3 C-terminal domain-containing protein [Clostridia bacterium]